MQTNNLIVSFRNYSEISECVPETHEQADRYLSDVVGKFRSMHVSLFRDFESGLSALVLTHGVSRWYELTHNYWNIARMLTGIMIHVPFIIVCTWSKSYGFTRVSAQGIVCYNKVRGLPWSLTCIIYIITILR